MDGVVDVKLNYKLHVCRLACQTNVELSWFHWYSSLVGLSGCCLLMSLSFNWDLSEIRGWAFSVFWQLILNLSVAKL